MTQTFGSDLPLGNIPIINLYQEFQLWDKWIHSEQRQFAPNYTGLIPSSSREAFSMIRLRIREFSLEVIRPKLWEAALLLALGIVGWLVYACLLR